MKNLFISLLILGFLAVGVLGFTANAQFGGMGGSFDQLQEQIFYTDGTNVFTADSSWGVGSAATPISAINVDDLIVNTTFTLGGTAGAGGIDMNGEIITNIGNTGTDFVASTGALTLAGVFTANGGIASTGELTVIASVDTSTLLTIQNTDTDVGTAGYLLELIHDANNDADADFLICQDDGAGTPDTLFSIASDGSVYIGASGNSLFNESVSIGNGSASTIDLGADAEADLYITDDLEVDGLITCASDILSTNTGDIGWSVVAQANQACNTTCTNACVFGQDSGDTDHIVACDDATADTCVCAGAN